VKRQRLGVGGLVVVIRGGIHLRITADKAWNRQRISVSVVEVLEMGRS
jgi:hypothetical protein